MKNVWHRIGSGNVYTELTFSPSGGVPRMMGSRGTGYASGMYAFGEEREGTIPVPPPENPLSIGGNPNRTKKARREAPREFLHDAISLLRFAEGDEEGYAGTSLDSVKMSLWMQAAPKGYDMDRAGEDVEWAIKTWRKHRQVHPMNILLNRWGYDGVEFVGEAEWAANSGDFGNVKFPPMTDDGKLKSGYIPTSMGVKYPENKNINTERNPMEEFYYIEEIAEDIVREMVEKYEDDISDWDDPHGFDELWDAADYETYDYLRNFLTRDVNLDEYEKQQMYEEVLDEVYDIIDDQVFVRKLIRSR